MSRVPPRADPPRHWLVRRRTRRWLWAGYLALLGLSLLAGRWIHPHGPFGFEQRFGFFALYGFGVCVAMVVLAKVLGIFLKRQAGYYDRPDGTAGQPPGDNPGPPPPVDNAAAAARADTRPGRVP